MKKVKLVHWMGVLVIIAAVSVGFYYNLGDNHSKSTPDATSYGQQFNGTGSDNITTGTWSAGATIGTKSLAGGAASYIRGDTGWLFYIGGDQDFSGTMTARNESYNTVTNSWSVNAPCPTTIEYTGCARLKDTIYIVGGMVTSFFSSETAVVQKYNIRTNTWSAGVSVPQALGANKCVGYQDSVIFCIGGMNAGGSNSVNNVYVFNSNTNLWRTGTALPSALMGGALTVVGDSLFYVGGGSSYFSGYVNTVYKGVLGATDKSVITWTTVAAYTGPSRWRFDAAPWGTKGIIVAAGGGNSTFGSSNECYVMTANTWIAQPNMTQAVGSAGVGSVIYSTGLGKLIVASGEDYPASPYTVNNCQIYTDTVGAPVTGGVWVEQTSGTTQSLNCVSTVSASVGWIGGNNGVVLLTTNGGTTWTNVTGSPIGTNAVYCICGIDASTCLVSTSPAATYIYKTTNAGGTWTQVYTMAGGFVDDIRILGNGNIFMYGDPVGARWELFKSTNLGSTWDSTGLYLPQAGSESGYNNAMCIRGNTIWLATNNTRVYYSTNGGVTGSWNNAPTTGDANQYSVDFNGNVGFCGEASAFTSTNGGVNWTTVTVPGTGTIYGFNNAFQEFWYTRGTNIYNSTNNGSNFASQYVSPSASTYDAMNIIVYYNIVRGWAVTSNGHISMYNENLVGVNNRNVNEVPKDFVLSQNYPNPFNPTTVIEYQVPKSTNVSLVVYDLLGREVQTLVNDFKQAGSYKISFNASNLSSGVYFYKLTAGDFVSTKKMMLVK